MADSDIPTDSTVLDSHEEEEKVPLPPSSPSLSSLLPKKTSKLELEENAWDRWFGIGMGGVLAAVIFSLLFITAFPSGWSLAAQLSLAIVSGGLSIMLEAVMDGKAMVEFSTKSRAFIWRQWRWFAFKTAQLQLTLSLWNQSEAQVNAKRIAFDQAWSDEIDAFGGKFNYTGMLWNGFLFLCLVLNAAGLMALSGSGFGTFMQAQFGWPILLGFGIAALPIFLMSLSFNCSLTEETFAPFYIAADAPKENYWDKFKSKIKGFLPTNWKSALGLLIVAPAIGYGVSILLDLLIPGLGTTLNFIISGMIAVAPALFVAPKSRATGLALVFALFAGAITASINITSFSRLPVEFLPTVVATTLMFASILPALVTQFFAAFNSANDYFKATTYVKFADRIANNFKLLTNKEFLAFAWQRIKAMVVGGDDKSHTASVVEARKNHLEEKLEKTGLLDWMEAKELHLCQKHPHALQAYIQISKIIILMGRAVGLSILTATCFATLFTVTGANPAAGVALGFGIMAAVLDAANQTFQNRTFCFEKSHERKIDEMDVSNITALLKDALDVAPESFAEQYFTEKTETAFNKVAENNDPEKAKAFEALRSQLEIHLTDDEKKGISLKAEEENKDYKELSEKALQEKISVKLARLKTSFTLSKEAIHNATNEFGTKYSTEWNNKSTLGQRITAWREGWQNQYEANSKTPSARELIYRRIHRDPDLVTWRKETIIRALQEDKLKHIEAEKDVGKTDEQKRSDAGWKSFSPFISVAAFFLGNGMNVKRNTTQAGTAPPIPEGYIDPGLAGPISVHSNQLTNGEEDPYKTAERFDCGSRSTSPTP